ncbi:hypothetical protein DL96DRAFT_1575704 [Flagelloscypha sp. PMI_526]|nr:hypothetical protein DL96DRAFT_1575704 [Flagelloscypha sp. PMI_526]
MRASLLPLFLAPLLAVAQNNNTNASVILSTSQTLIPTLGPGRVASTITSNVVFTITPTPNVTSTASGNATATGNSTVSAGNGTTTSRTTTASNLPTAPAISGGGAQGGAPYPGASQNCGGACGPDDDYINAARRMVKNSLTVGAITAVLGAGMLFV